MLFRYDSYGVEEVGAICAFGYYNAVCKIFRFQVIEVGVYFFVELAKGSNVLEINKSFDHIFSFLVRDVIPATTEERVVVPEL